MGGAPETALSKRYGGLVLNGVASPSSHRKVLRRVHVGSHTRISHST